MQLHRHLFLIFVCLVSTVSGLCEPVHLDYSFDDLSTLFITDLAAHYSHYIHDIHTLNQVLHDIQSEHPTVEQYIPNTCLELAIHSKTFIEQVSGITERNTTYWLERYLGSWLSHSVYFKTLASKEIVAGHPRPAGVLAEALEETYGGFEEFQEGFNAAATSLFGYGWVWLGVDVVSGHLLIESNKDNHLPMFGNIRPILVLDLWEHAFYETYHNKRDKYINTWWNFVNWPQVKSLYIDAISRHEAHAAAYAAFETDEIESTIPEDEEDEHPN